MSRLSLPRPASCYRSSSLRDSIAEVSGSLTTVEVQQWLDHLESATRTQQADEVVRALLTRSANRLYRLCSSLLHRRYPRLARGPVNLQPDELLSAVVERLIKALREARPNSVGQFFSLANQHLRWELNDVARRYDARGWALELSEQQPAQRSPMEEPTRDEQSEILCRILQAIESLPEVERDTFNLVRIQGMPQVDAAEFLGVSTKTVHRRLNQCVVRLSAELRDLLPSRVSQYLRREVAPCPTARRSSNS